MYFFTADEHYGHRNIIEYSNRPFASVEEMNEEMINRHNSVVGPEDTTRHLGDFTLATTGAAKRIIDRLNGRHIFIPGSHDRWIPKAGRRVGDNWRVVDRIDDVKVHGQLIIMCHYMMYTWPASHYGSWQLFGHSHGGIQTTFGKQHDVGVDNNDFYPVSMSQLREIMEDKPDNWNMRGNHHG